MSRSKGSDPRQAGGAGGGGFKVGNSPDLVSSNLVKRFYEFWRSRGRDGALPSKVDMDPAEMAPFLANIILTEVLHDPLDFRYRIIGEEVIARTGNNTGKRVREMALNNLSGSAYQNYCTVVTSREPQFLEGDAITASKPGRPYLMSRVHCPLSSDGKTVDFIISCVSFHHR